MAIGRMRNFHGLVIIPSGEADRRAPAAVSAFYNSIENMGMRIRFAAAILVGAFAARPAQASRRAQPPT